MNQNPHSLSNPRSNLNTFWSWLQPLLPRLPSNHLVWFIQNPFTDSELNCRFRKMNQSVLSAFILILSITFISSEPLSRPRKNDKKLKDIQTATSTTGSNSTTLPSNSTLPTSSNTSEEKKEDLDKKKDFDTKLINNTINTETTDDSDSNDLDCDPIYLRFSSNHTACKDYNDKCNITKVSDHSLILWYAMSHPFDHRSIDCRWLCLILNGIFLSLFFHILFIFFHILFIFFSFSFHCCICSRKEFHPRNEMKSLTFITRYGTK